jgi:hypothetical protein
MNTIDERAIIDILCTRNKDHLDAIDVFMRRENNQTLKEFIESEISGDLGKFLGYTQMTTDEFDGYLLNKAFSGISCDQDLIIELMTTRSYNRLREAL